LFRTESMVGLLPEYSFKFVDERGNYNVLRSTF
jgi:hypothetical protein